MMSTAVTVDEKRRRYQYDVVLRDGSIVRIQPIQQNDGDRLRDLGRRLSPDSLYNRFFHLPDVDTARLDLLVNVDYQNSFALVAELHGRIIAVSRYVRDENRPDTAVMAVVVDDRVQGKGLGTAMLDRLAEVARDHGVQIIEGEVYAHNHRMLNMVAASGFEIVQRLDGGLVRVELDLRPTPEYEKRLQERLARSAVASVRIFLEPESVAVVGASRDRSKIGSVVLQNLLSMGYTGRIIPINPKADEIEGLPAYPRVTDVPDPVDLVVIAVPLEFVEAVVDDCIERGVRGILLLTAGFSEVGQEGRQREKQLVERLRNAGIRLIGPNCFGLINTDRDIRLNTSFSPTQPLEGTVGLMTQSGALGQTILDYSRELNLGLSNFVSVGNKADISGNDLLQYWSQDDRTNVVLLYLESFGNPRKFSRIARNVARAKPIVCVKAGRSSAGARAASSHTGSFVGSDEAANALFRQCGVIRTNTLEELFDTASLLAHQPLPSGPRVAVVTNAGGPAIMAADACDAHGLELPALDDRTTKTLRSFLPDAASVSNPVDMIAGADASDYARAMEALLDDPNVDSVLVLFVPLQPGSPERVAEAIRRSIPEGCAKPVLATFLSSQGMPPALAGVPSYRFPEAAASALGRSLRYARWRDQPTGRVVSFEDMDHAAMRTIVETAQSRGGGWLSAEEVNQLLAQAGLNNVRSMVVDSLDSAVEAAASIGYPVVLKAVGPEILHKTEVGGVKLNLESEQELRSAYEDLAARLGDQLAGVLVQSMIQGGVEALIGATFDEVFGHTIAYGSGGELVELTRDVALRLHPLTDRDADELLEEVQVTRLIRGWRGSSPSDENAVRESLLRLSAMLETCPEIEEVDFNPIRVQQHGAIIVDARVRIGSSWRRPGPSPMF